MERYNMYYLSGITNDNTVAVAAVNGAGTSVSKNISIQDFSVPLLQAAATISSDDVTELDGNLVEFSVPFAPFLLTDVSKNGKPFYFKHVLNNGRYPYNVKIYMNTGEVVDPSRYYIGGTDTKPVLYHNLVNKKGAYYFVEFVRQSVDGTIDYGFRELLNSTPIYHPTEWEGLLSEDPYAYYVEVTEDDLVVRTTAATSFYILYDNRELVSFQADYPGHLHWWLSVKNFSYKLPTADKVFTVNDMYEAEEFYPQKGMNVIREYDLVPDENNVIFLSSFPIAYSAIEYPILDLDMGTNLPVKSIDPYAGAVELDRDFNLEREENNFDVSYYVYQDAVVLDQYGSGLETGYYPNFNPSYNDDVSDRFYLAYLRKNEGADAIHIASFMGNTIDGVTDFYLADVEPADSVFTKYEGNLSLTDFMRLFDIVENPTSDYAVLFLGFIVAHNTETPGSLYKKAKDIRMLGGGVANSELEEVLETYKEVQYFWELQPLDGDVEPVMTASMILVPKEVLTKMDKDGILSRVKKHCGSGGFNTIMTDTANNEIVLVD